MHIFPDGRVSALDAAQYLGISAASLANLRSRGLGPRFIKIGRIFYRISDLDDFINDRSALTTAEARIKTQRTAA